MQIDFAHIALGSASIVSTIGNVFLWRKLKSESHKIDVEAKGSELENVEQAIKIWRELAEENKRENHQLKKDIAELKLEMSELRADLILVHRENKALKDYLVKQGIDYQLIKNESN